MTRLVAVTGAAGFVGRAIVARLLSEGHGVRALVHKGELPQDIELAEAAGGAACAQLLDGGTLLCLDVPGDRVSISRLDKYFT